jgi:hypothetical protein
MRSSQSNQSETGMPTIGYVAFTIGILAALATFSGIATPFAIILALPALILCRKAHRIYKSRFQKASGILVVLLVLNWIGTVVSGLFLLVALAAAVYLYGFQNSKATADPVSSYTPQNSVPRHQDNTAIPPSQATPERIWARGLNASATELSSADMSLVESVFKQISEMSSAEGRLMKVWGTGVETEDAFKRDAPVLLETWTSALAKAQYYQAGIADPGAKRFLGDLLDAEYRVCDAYRQLYSCVLAADYDAANRNITSLNALKKQKGDLYAKMAAGMRQVGGPAVDSYLFQGINEAAQDLRTQ